MYNIFEMLRFVYLGFYVAFNTVQIISRRVVGRAEETSTYIYWNRKVFDLLCIKVIKRSRKIRLHCINYVLAI